MDDRRWRAAVIGLGRIGSTFDDEMGPYGRWRPPMGHAGIYHAMPNVDLVAGADPHPDQRAAFATRWGLDPARVYADYQELLARERPDIVSICTTARPRARILLGVVAAEAGVKAIFAEKPLAISLAEADAMVEACARAGIPLAVGTTRCSDGIYNRIRELIDRGEIGQVLQVNGFGHCGLSHNGSHLLTLVTYLAGGRCQSVFGRVESDAAARSDDDFSGNAYLEYDNGVQAFIRALPCGPAEWEFDVIGTTGRLRAVNDGEEVDFWQVQPGTLPGRRREIVRRLFPMPQVTQSSGVRLVADLIASVETGRPPTCSGAAARDALEIAVAIRESHRRGGVRVDLPLADRSLKINSAETLHGDEPVAIRRRRG